MRIRCGDVLRNTRLRLLNLLLQVARAAAELLRLLVRDAIRTAFDRIGRFDLVKVFLPLRRLDEFGH
ncbi:hypothetical protein WM34_29645 [Burkholderia ubonensis]|nr:hypothetical protein WJ74_30425 [Burkholderia ubonensis]KWD09692.1 hypothetical protein WL59_03605 [Burkholderia ubonensis]KWD13289.1 hypothetical protein WL60_17565 [Burkholderia ubonensis]KWQ01081.1 hypothetical protein WM34_29645 [Burkholderia ubonensis]